MRHPHCHDHDFRRFAGPFSMHFLWHAIGRHAEHRRGTGRGRGHHGFGGEGDGMPRGRMVSSDDLQLLVLALLDQEPRHGYELIKALEAHSNGFYSPSPGMIYPALTYLEELGYVTAESDGNRKRFALAPGGRDYLTEHRAHADMILARLAEIGRKMDSVRRAFAGEEVDDASTGRRWAPELHAVRRALKQALSQAVDAPAARQRKIAAILKRALAEIEAIVDGAAD